MEIGRLRKQFAWILVDTPPHAETETRTALREADIVLVPCQPSMLDVWASRPTLEVAAKEGRRPNVVLNRVPARGRALDEARGALDELGAAPLDKTLGSRQAFVTCLVQGLGVVESEPRSVAADEARALAESLSGLTAGRR
jgi:chromosome partitioning protein